MAERAGRGKRFPCGARRAGPGAGRGAREISWFRTIPFGETAGRLRKLCDRVTGPGHNVDNIMLTHSLRPHTMEGHMALYKATIHHSGNKIPKSFLETIGVWVSLLNNCSYCVEHHFAGLVRLLKGAPKTGAIRAALNAQDITPSPLTFSARESTALIYARVLTRDPGAVTETMINDLRTAGWSDGEILEINQVTAYFCYANRTVLGLGCNTDGEVLGLSPGNSDDPNDWGHG